mgnify:FL=1
MPFWKKSEDPWDYEPEKPSRPAEPGQEEKDCAPSLMDERRGWNEERKEKKALRETPPPPMICPWCGQEMEVGTITGGRDSVQWWPGWPNRFFGASGPEIDILHEGSLFNRYKTAWLCRSCRRISGKVQLHSTLPCLRISPPPVGRCSADRRKCRP